ncbi:FecR family protein [Echinicola sediminis]
MDQKTLREILKKYELGECSKEELIILFHFFESYQNDSDIWAGKAPSEKDRIRKELEKRIADRVVIGEDRKLARTSKIIWKVAATILLLISIGMFTNKLFIGEESDEAYDRFVADDKGIRKIELADGSIIWLNRNSELLVPKRFTSGNSRKVNLKGEAYFEIAKDKNRPFMVTSGNISTKVLGTHFNIRERKESIEVALLEGSIQVENEYEQVLLSPMEKVVHQTDGNFFKIYKVDKQLELAWMSNGFEFKQTPLSRVAAILERRFHKQVTFEEDWIGNRKVTGNYRNQSLNTILFSITRAGNLEYKYQDDGHILIINPKN